MFQLDEKFLQDIGLGDLPDDQKSSFLQYVYEELELRVGEKLAAGMSESQMAEFEKILDRDHEMIEKWLDENAPEYENNDDFKQHVEKAQQAGAPEDSVLPDYAATKWLETNAPNYRDVVGEEMKKLRQEIEDHKDEILKQMNAPADTRES